MSDSTSKSLDILGVKPIGDAVKVATESTFAGASAFLSRICLPAAEEFGLLLKDRVSHWRASNAARIAEMAEAKLQARAVARVQAHPRLVFEVIEKGSWTDDDTFQKAWAGILASSCSDDGKDDSNIIFTSLLSQLTGTQLRILNYAVETAPKWVSQGGLPYADGITLNVAELTQITNISDIHRLDLEMEHMRALELLHTFGSGFDLADCLATIQITSLALHLFVRGQGYVGSPVEYFGLKPNPSGDGHTSRSFLVA